MKSWLNSLKEVSSGGHFPCGAAEAWQVGERPWTDDEIIQLSDHADHCRLCAALLAADDCSEDAVLDVLDVLPPSDDDEPEFSQLYRDLLASVPDATHCRVALAMAVAEEETYATLRTARDEGELTAAMQFDHDLLANGCLPTGVTQLGKYRLEACIGRGAYGTVYRARHIHLDQLFAVKTLNALRLGGKVAVERFIDEMKAAGNLVHPCIIRATDAGHDEGLYYLVMEYVEGVDAGRLVRAMGRLPLAEACELVRQTALGLAFAHRQRLVHRDVKPANVLVGLDGQVKLLDLGLALRRDSAQRVDAESQSPLGTAQYMAPEQWTRSADVDLRADLYSLGCMLFKLIAGHSPFAAAASPSQSLEECHRSVAPPSLCRSRSGIPRSLDRLIAQMLAKSPADRPASADAIAQALAPHCASANLPGLLARVVEGAVDDGSRVDPRMRTAQKRPRFNISRRTVLAGGGAACLAALWTRWRKAPQLARGPWRPLEPADPPLLLTLNEHSEADAAQWSYDEIAQTGMLSSERLALLQFGRPVVGPWQLEVKLKQDSWESGTGVFFQWRCSAPDDPFQATFQSVEAVSGDASDGQARLLWSEWRVTQSAGKLDAVCEPWAEATIGPISGLQSHALRISVGRQGFPQVAWNGILQDDNAWTASTEGRRQQSLAPDLWNSVCLGPIGLLQARGVVEFFQPRFAYLDS